jgi:hypothetical protein
MFSTISWETINEELKKVFTELVKIGIPQTEKIYLAKIAEIQEERPYLINYIDESDFDIAGFWEDMAGKNGSLISPSIFREFMTPYYRKLTDFIKSKA